ncbi:MAG: Rieske 2Fe-2S domain-containing protein, partial [Thermomicrobiales bacterium]
MTYLKHVWYCAALSSELTSTPIARTICDTAMVLFRTEAGNTVALEDRCCHRQAPLSMGRVFGETIECGYHGFTFDAIGTCVHIPHQDRIPAAACIRHFPTAERNGLVWLWIGDPAAPDHGKIPTLPGVGEEGHRTVYMSFYANANFQLMADNLMDNSLTDFLHRDSIGSHTGRRGQENMPRI